MEPDPGLGISGPLDGPGEVRGRLVQSALPPMELAQRGVGVVGFGLEPDGRLEVGQRVREPAGLEIHAPPIHQQRIAIVVCRVQGQGGAVVGLGGLESGRRLSPESGIPLPEAGHRSGRVPGSLARRKRSPAAGRVLPGRGGCEGRH